MPLSKKIHKKIPIAICKQTHIYVLKHNNFKMKHFVTPQCFISKEGRDASFKGFLNKQIRYLENVFISSTEENYEAQRILLLHRKTIVIRILAPVLIGPRPMPIQPV